MKSAFMMLPDNSPETCDRCGTGVNALFVLFLASGGMLTLCGHHTRKVTNRGYRD